MLDLGNNRRSPTTAHLGGIPSIAAFVVPKVLGLTFSLSRSTPSLSFFHRHSISFTSSPTPTPLEAPELNYRRISKPPWTTDQIRLLASLLRAKGPVWTELSKTGGFDPPRSSSSLNSAYERWIKGRSRAASSLAAQEGRPRTGRPDDVFRIARKDKVRWTLEEDYILAKGVELYGAQHWNLIAADLPGRRPNDCTTRWSQYKKRLASWIVSEWDEVQKGVRALETLMTTLMREAPEDRRGRKTLTGESLKRILDAVKADMAEKGYELPPELLTTMMLRRLFHMVKLHTYIAKIHVQRYPEASMHSPQVAAIKFVAERTWRQYKTGKLEKVTHWKVYAEAESKPDSSVTNGGSSPGEKAKEQRKNKSSSGQKKTTGKGVSAAPKLKSKKVNKPRKNT